MSEPLEPSKTVCVVKHEGKEVGRIAASAKNASDYIQELALHCGRQGGSVTVDYERDENAWLYAALRS